MVRLVPSEDLRGFVGVDRVKVRKGEVESVRRRATQSRVMFQTMNWAVSARCGLNSPVSRSAESWIAGVARSSICRGSTFCFVARRAETTCSTSVARSRVKPESVTLPTPHFLASPSRDGKPPRALPAGSRSVPYCGLYQVPAAVKFGDYVPAEIPGSPATGTLAVSHFS